MTSSTLIFSFVIVTDYKNSFFLGGLIALSFVIIEMSVELSEAKEQVAIFQKECDDYLVILVEQKREADEQTKVFALFRVP